MTIQMKILTGLFVVLLIAALVWMVPGERKPVSVSEPSGPAVAEKEVPGQMKNDPLKTPAQSRPETASRNTTAGSNVSQAQIDLVKKREEARIRRDEMMAVRTKTIQENWPGNTGEPQQ